MITLKAKESFDINSLDDLINCPINMYDEAIRSIKETWLVRIDKMEKSGKALSVKNARIRLTNDGIDKYTVKIGDEK